MGAPAFFEWISGKYPSMVEPCIKQKSRVNFSNARSAKIKSTDNVSNSNTNNLEFDDLYFDMDRIIQRCCQPTDNPAPKNEDELMALMFDYMDNVFDMVRPRLLVYMALGGVAANAKMNQERSRRFKTTESQEEMPTLGTDFVYRLADSLSLYIQHRQKTDPAWANLTVIFSDANIPGEGEQKIVDYIRRQRDQEEYDLDTYHCLCGSEFNLIMLGLATHEFNVTIIQETLTKTLAHEFVFLRLDLLRSVLSYELNMPYLPFPHDEERALDDWILLTCFTGNDFLPSLPSLAVQHGGMETLVMFYKKVVFQTNGYLTNRGVVDMPRLQLLFQLFSTMEDDIFKYRREHELTFKQEDQRRVKRLKLAPAKVKKQRLQLMLGQLEMIEDLVFKDKEHSILTSEQRNDEKRNHQQHAVTTNEDPPRFLGCHRRRVTDDTEEFRKNNDVRFMEASQRICFVGQQNKCKNEPVVPPKQCSAATARINKTEERSRQRKRKAEDNDAGPIIEEEVKRWQVERQNLYYSSNFGHGSNNEAFITPLIDEYLRGVCWTINFYYHGCTSWNWSYLHQHAPLASDFVNIGSRVVEFDVKFDTYHQQEHLTRMFQRGNEVHQPYSRPCGFTRHGGRHNNSIQSTSVCQMSGVAEGQVLLMAGASDHPSGMNPSNCEGVKAPIGTKGRLSAACLRNLLSDVDHQPLDPRPLESRVNQQMCLAPPPSCVINQWGYGAMPLDENTPEQCDSFNIINMVNQAQCIIIDSYTTLAGGRRGRGHPGLQNEEHIESYTTISGGLRRAGGAGLVNGRPLFSYPPPPSNY